MSHCFPVCWLIYSVCATSVHGVSYMCQALCLCWINLVPFFSQPIGILPPFKVKEHFRFLLYLLRCSQATGISPDSFVSSFSSFCTILSRSPQVILPGFCCPESQVGVFPPSRLDCSLLFLPWPHSSQEVPSVRTVPPSLTAAVLAFCEAPPSTLLLRGLTLTVPPFGTLQSQLSV